MPRFTDQEFLEKSSVHTLLAYSRNPNINNIEFTCIEPGGKVYTYIIPRDDVLEELAKREHIPNKKERRGRPSSDKKKLKYTR